MSSNANESMRHASALITKIRETAPPCSEDIRHLAPEQPSTEIWVRGGDGVARLVDQVFERLEFHRYVDLACIGAGAVNQGIKAVASARARAASAGRDLLCRPFFSVVLNDAGDEKTRLVLRVITVPA